MPSTKVIDEFIDFVRDSLSGDYIAKLYYGLNYWKNTEDYINVVAHDTRFKNEFTYYLERYHERVFCYELYHQLRSRMDGSKRAYGNIFLQSEVRKEKLPHELLEFFRLTENLAKNYMPDFLLHTPGDFTNQLVVMEVKVNPKILISDIAYDINKVAEFMNQKNYRYERGIFLSVNVQAEYVFSLIADNANLFRNIPNEIRSEIIVMTKCIEPDLPPNELTLYQIIGDITNASPPDMN